MKFYKCHHPNTGSDADSDSDNCTPQKMGSGNPGGSLDSDPVLDEDFDFIGRWNY